MIRETNAIVIPTPLPLGTWHDGHTSLFRWKEELDPSTGTPAFRPEIATYQAYFVAKKKSGGTTDSTPGKTTDPITTTTTVCRLRADRRLHPYQTFSDNQARPRGYDKYQKPSTAAGNGSM